MAGLHDSGPLQGSPATRGAARGMHVAGLKEGARHGMTRGEGCALWPHKAIMKAMLRQLVAPLGPLHCLAVRHHRCRDTCDSVRSSGGLALPHCEAPLVSWPGAARTSSGAAAVAPSQSCGGSA